MPTFLNDYIIIIQVILRVLIVFIEEWMVNFIPKFKEIFL